MKQIKPLAPEWTKVWDSAGKSVRELHNQLKTLDSHFTGKIMAEKAIEAQKGSYFKNLGAVKSEAMRLEKELKPYKSPETEAEYYIFREIVSEMSKENSGIESWECEKFIKLKKSEWMAGVKATTHKELKKLVTQTKLFKLLDVHAKTAKTYNQAVKFLASHVAMWNRLYVQLGNNLSLVDQDLKKLSGELAEIKKLADQLDRSSADN